jgi:hypothetical protein
MICVRTSGAGGVTAAVVAGEADGRSETAANTPATSAETTAAMRVLVIRRPIVRLLRRGGSTVPGAHPAAAQGGVKLWQSGRIAGAPLTPRRGAGAPGAAQSSRRAAPERSSPLPSPAPRSSPEDSVRRVVDVDVVVVATGGAAVTVAAVVAPAVLDAVVRE